MNAFKKATIEISSGCNAKCTWCTTGKKNRSGCSDKTEFMSAESFEKGLSYMMEKGIIGKKTEIELYNWGEPFLNPEINTICGIITKYGFQYHLSTNASVYREINAEYLTNLSGFRVSLSGFSKESYAITHSLNFTKVMDNIVKFCDMLKAANKQNVMDITFLVYKFNCHEINKAKDHFNNLGIKFTPRLAYYNDFEQFQAFLNKSMPDEMKKMSEEQIFEDLLSKRASEAPAHFRCPQDDFIVLSYDWKIVPCCRLTENETLGNLFDMDADQIREKKNQIAQCAECKQSNQHYIVHSPTVFTYSIDPKSSKNRQIKVVAKLYPDYNGEGYSEDTAVAFGNYDADSESFYGEHTFETAPERIRFDPVGGSFCVAENVRVSTEKGKAAITCHNGIKYGDFYVFDHFDSQFIFENKNKSRKFRIKADIYPFNSLSAITFMDKVTADNKDLLENNRRLESEKADLASDKKKLEGEKAGLASDKKKLESKVFELNCIIGSNTKKYNDFKYESAKKNEQLEKEIENKNKEIEKKIKELESANAVIRSDREIAGSILSAGSRTGGRYAAACALKHGFFAARTNAAAIKIIRKNGGFDALYYCRKYGDVAESGMDPLLHYIWYGGYEGRNPSESFDSAKYLAAYEDVKKSGVNPFAHYVVFGKDEGRKAGNKEVNKKVKGERKNKKKNINVKDKSLPMLSSRDLLEVFQEFYNYSALQPKLFPQKIFEHQQVEYYMNVTEKTLEEMYTNMDQEIKVSIIMPTYNRALVIGQAIESVQKQSYTNWELIIIDDNSDDNTEEVVSKYCTEDSRVIFIKNNKKKGVCGARNTGLEHSKGEYIAYLDTDNDWKDDYLLLMVQTLKLNRHYASIYCAQAVYLYENNRPCFQHLRFGAYNHSVIKNKNYIDMNCYMHKYSLYKQYGGFSENLTRFVDWELIHRYSYYGYPYELPCCLSNYYHDKADNQITEKSIESYNEKINVFDKEVTGERLQLVSEKYLDVNQYEFYSDKINVYECSERNVSIVIPSYEALSCLIACIEAVKKFTEHINYEIIIVDNNSSDIVKEYLKELQNHEERVKVIFNDYNMGFTYAVNQGIQLAMPNSDIVLLNNDAIVTNGWIEELYRVKDNVNAGIIVPRQVLIPNTKTMDIHIPNCQKSRELDVSVSVHHHNVADLRKYHNFGYINLSFAPFFLVMITRECFEKLGYLDEKNGRHYKSDRLYCQKAQENGIEIVYTPFSKAYHLLQQSTAALKQSDMQMYKIIFEKNDWSDVGYISSSKDDLSKIMEEKS